MKTKTKFQREMYELAGEFVALRNQAVNLYRPGEYDSEVIAIARRAVDCAIEAADLAEGGE
jgi:hypothetical protein